MPLYFSGILPLQLYTMRRLRYCLALFRLLISMNSQEIGYSFVRRENPDSGRTVQRWRGKRYIYTIRHTPDYGFDLGNYREAVEHHSLG
jgi:hypothetical protein